MHETTKISKEISYLFVSYYVYKFGFGQNQTIVHICSSCQFKQRSLTITIFICKNLYQNFITNFVKQTKLTICYVFIYRENLAVKSHCKLFNAQQEQENVLLNICTARFKKKHIASAEKVFEHDHNIFYITFRKSDSLFLLLGGCDNKI